MQNMSKTKREPKTFTVHDVQPIQAINHKQKRFFKSYFTEQKPITMQYGSAGTGKTLLAFYAALTEVLSEHKNFDRVIVIRSAVQTRDIGFLKGDEEEKNEIYEATYSGICDEVMKYQWNNYRNLKEGGYIEFENTSFLRGKTFDNAIIIFDEFQSATYHEMSTVMTRLGQNSKIIFCGDIKQTDLHRKGDVSGFGKFVDIIYAMDPSFVSMIEYGVDDIVRSGVVKEFLRVEEQAA